MAYLAELRSVAPTTRRQLRHWGAFRTSLLPKSGMIPMEMGIHMLATSRRCNWHIKDGLVVLPTASSVLARRASKLLLALTSVTIRDLCKSIQEDGRLAPLTDEETACILKAHDRFRSNRGQVRLVRGTQPLIALTSAECAALAVFHRSDGVVDRELYHHSMITAGFQGPLADAVLRSPFIVRIERGIYALRGRSFRPSQIRFAKQASSNRFRRTLVRFTQDNAGAILHYRLTIPSVNTGRLPLPSSVRLQVGDWSTYFPDDTIGMVQVKKSSLRGLRPWMRRAGVSVGSRITLEMNKENRVIHVIALSEQRVDPAPALL